MSYNNEFYKKYEKYLLAPTVRKVHNKMLNYFAKLFPVGKILNVLDFGCGLCEYHKYGAYDSYLGIDKNHKEFQVNVINEDYATMTKEKLKEIIKTYNISAFVSLFSTECCLSTEEKYKLYESIFCENECIIGGIVSGFFYKRKEDQEKVLEVCGLESYQTVEPQKDHELFTEIKIYKDVPSEMFGQDVVEVWKILLRNE
jgi:hypothetical protein